MERAPLDRQAPKALGAKSWPRDLPGAALDGVEDAIA